MQSLSRRQFVRLGLATALLAMATAPALADRPRGGIGAVYTMSNASTGNEILVFDRHADGSLHPMEAVSTGGVGTSSGLGNQAALVLSKGERFLFAVNAGSNDISVFRVRRSGLELVDRTSSQGTRPVSLALLGHLLYVLNAGSDDIAGFHVGHDGRLTPLSGSIQPLSGAGTAPTQIAFAADGRVLVITEKATDKIVTYQLDRWDLPVNQRVFDAASPTPFGFAVTRRGDIVVSEAAGGAAGASVVSSYDVARAGGVSVVSSIATGQSAVCWVEITPDGRFAYATNTGSNNLSGFRIDEDGSLRQLGHNSVVAEAGAGPIDLALSRNGRYLYTLNAGDGTISAFRVRDNGQLVPIRSQSGLPAGANGLAAR